MSNVKVSLSSMTLTKWDISSTFFEMCELFVDLYNNDAVFVFKH